jgi:hypothetical protein
MANGIDTVEAHVERERLAAAKPTLKYVWVLNQLMCAKTPA